MIDYIFGLVGLSVFILAICISLLKSYNQGFNNNKINHLYYFSIFIIFIFMSFFTPLHQFPIGLFFVAIAFALRNTQFKFE